MTTIRHRLVMLSAVILTVAVPCVAQETQIASDATPAVSGTGKPGHIAIWQSTTNLTGSGIVAMGGKVGIGTTAPAAKLEVNGNVQVDGNVSLSGSLLETGAGQLLWAPNDGSGNLSTGLGALPSATTGINNTALGTNALGSDVTGGANVALGWSALQGNTIGGANNAIGFAALKGNVSGSSNNAVGEFSLAANVTGNGNTAVGDTALGSNTSGNQNTAMGFGALINNTAGVYNTAIGSNSMSGSSGTGNTAIGAYSMLYVNGNSNTTIGQDALTNSQSTSGNGNIAIGYFAGAKIINQDNNIEIGSQGTSSDSGTIRIGTPVTQTSAYIAGIYGSSTGLANVGVVVDANGNLGTVQSSRRYKQDISDMADSSDGLMQLRPVTFRYKKPCEDGSKPLQYGLIAEEVAEVYPDLVARSPDGQVESVRYQLLDPMLLNELQKQHATIQAQKEQIHSLEERLAKIEAALGNTRLRAEAK